MIDLDPALGEQLLDISIRKTNRRYQRTARTITSGGNRKPLNAEGATWELWRERWSIIAHSHRFRPNATVPVERSGRPGWR
jgi:hypothetical protein